MTSSKGKQPLKEGSHLSGLIDALFANKSQEECLAFLEDLCTPLELRSMADRWRVAQLLNEGVAYRTIYERTGVSTATITRVARALSYGTGGYKSVLSKFSPANKDTASSQKEPSL